MGRTIISKDIKSATTIAKKINSRLKIVSLEGDLINPGGAITGGSSNNNSKGLLGRSRKIEDLKQDINKIETELDQKSDTGIKLKEKIEDNKSKIKQKQQQLHQLDLNMNNLSKDKENINQKISKR